jgi:hypothetical protein
MRCICGQVASMMSMSVRNWTGAEEVAGCNWWRGGFETYGHVDVRRDTAIGRVLGQRAAGERGTDALTEGWSEHAIHGKLWVRWYE